MERCLANKKNAVNRSPPRGNGQKDNDALENESAHCDSEKCLRRTQQDDTFRALHDSNFGIYAQRFGTRPGI